MYESKLLSLYSNNVFNKKAILTEFQDEKKYEKIVLSGLIDNIRLIK